DSVVIRPRDADTTINHGTNAIRVDGIGGYNIQMNGGGDDLMITSTRAKGALFVDLGAGDDKFGFADAGHRGPTAVRGGDGNDLIVFGGFSVFRALAVDTGAGDDGVVADNIGAVHIAATNPSGSD